MAEKDLKKQPIEIEANGQSLNERVRLQAKALHDFLEKEMPECGWMYNKGVCCYYTDMPMVFAKCSSLYAEYDEDRSETETRMFLLVSVLHPKDNVCRCCYKMNGNKKEILTYLSEDSHVKDIADAIMQMSNSMKEKDH